MSMGGFRWSSNEIFIELRNPLFFTATSAGLVYGVALLYYVHSAIHTCQPLCHCVDLISSGVLISVDLINQC